MFPETAPDCTAGSHLWNDPFESPSWVCIDIFHRVFVDDDMKAAFMASRFIVRRIEWKQGAYRPKSCGRRRLGISDP